MHPAAGFFDPAACILKPEVVYFVHTTWYGVLPATGAVPVGNSAAQFHFIVN